MQQVVKLFSFNFLNISFEKGAFKDAPPILFVIVGSIALILAVVVGLSTCFNSDDGSEYIQNEDTGEVKSYPEGTSGESSEEILTIPSESFSLYKEDQTSGTIAAVEPSVSDYSGEIYYDVIIFNVSTIDDVGHSMETQSIEFPNTENYSKFTGTFFVPKRNRTLNDNIVCFRIFLDGIPYEKEYEVSKDSSGVPFEIDISNKSKVEIACYYVEGTASDVLGGGSYAYGALSNGLFTDPIMAVE